MGQDQDQSKTWTPMKIVVHDLTMLKECSEAALRNVHEKSYYEADETLCWMAGYIVRARKNLCDEISEAPESPDARLPDDWQGQIEDRPMELKELIRNFDMLIIGAGTAEAGGNVDDARGYLRQAKDLLVEEFVSE